MGCTTHYRRLVPSAIRLQWHGATVISARSDHADIAILHRWSREETLIRIYLQRGGGNRQDCRRVIGNRRSRWSAPSPDGPQV